MKSSSISEVIRMLSTFSVLIPVLLYSIKFKGLSRPIHVIGLLLIMSGLSDAFGMYLSARQMSTVYLFNSFYLLNYVLLIIFFYQVFVNLKHRTVLQYLVIAFAIGFVTITASIQPFSEYQTLVWVMVAITMILCSIIYLLNSFTEFRYEPVSNEPLILINSGILIYFILNLFLFIMGNYVLTRMDKELSSMVWSFHNVNNIIKNVLFAIGIYTFDQVKSKQMEQKPWQRVDSAPKATLD